MALDGWQVVVCRRRAVVPRPFTYLSPTAPMPPLISPSLPYPTPSISTGQRREGRRFAQCRACFRVSSALHLSAVRALCPLAPWHDPLCHLSFADAIVGLRADFPWFWKCVLRNPTLPSLLMTQSFDICLYRYDDNILIIQYCVYNNLFVSKRSTIHDKFEIPIRTSWNICNFACSLHRALFQSLCSTYQCLFILRNSCKLIIVFIQLREPFSQLMHKYLRTISQQFTQFAKHIQYSINFPIWPNKGNAMPPLSTLRLSNPICGCFSYFIFNLARTYSSS